MIGILQNKNLNSDKLSKIIEWHWKNVETLIDESPYKNKVKSLKKDLGKIKLKDIIIATPSEFPGLLQRLSKKDFKKYTIKKPGKKTNKSASEKHIFTYIYEKYRQKYGSELVEKLELSVCPYCNRNFINSIGDKTPAQFDHFFSKSYYPIFALSFYNLIPCCPTCNQWKSVAKFEISPYDKNFTTDGIIKFSFIAQGVNEFEIEITALDEKMKVNIERLRLFELYSTHKNIINELIFKKRIYCSSNQAFLKSLVKNMSLPNDMSFEELLYGNYLSEDKYYLRPLSKFTHDILAELNGYDNE